MVSFESNFVYQFYTISAFRKIGRKLGSVLEGATVINKLFQIL